MPLKFVFPALHISTAEAYSGIKPKFPQTNLLDLISEPLENWKGKVKNDFEISIFRKHPKLKVMKKHLYADGAIYASMSGSGSVLFGIFSR